MAAVGCAQEFQLVWTARKRDTDPGMCPQFSFTREQRRVSVFYLYIWDSTMGSGFIKICTYLPYPVKAWVNGHEWAKRQAAAAGIGSSASGVNPATSQNSTEHTRRSATGPAAARATAPDPAATMSAVPHSPQNFWPGELALPHERQASPSAAPHSPQNFWPDGLSAEHRGQIILAEGYRSPAGAEKTSTAAGPQPRQQAARPGLSREPAPRPSSRPARHRRRAHRFRAGLGTGPPRPVDERGAD